MSSVEDRLTAVENEITKIYKHLLKIANLISTQSDTTEVMGKTMEALITKGDTK